MIKRFSFLIVAVLVVGCTRTECSRADLKESFRNVRMGETILEVYGKLGPPLFVDVNPDPKGEGWSRSKTLRAADIKEIMEMLSNPGAVASLHYSQPRKAGDNYFLYKVEVQQNRVIKIIGPAYMD